VLHSITVRFYLRSSHFVISLSFSNICHVTSRKLRLPQCIKIKSDSHETWKCAKAELHGQIRCFPYVELSDVPWLQQVEKKAVGRQRNLGTTAAPAYHLTLRKWCYTPLQHDFALNHHFAMLTFIFESTNVISRYQLNDDSNAFRRTAEESRDYSSTCIWSIYFLVDTIFQSLWFLDRGLLPNKEATEPRVPLS
jgi:hypothetical protein